MKRELQAEVEAKLLQVLSEVEVQENVGAHYAPGTLAFADHMKQIREYIDIAGEYEVAYETLLATTVKHPFSLSSQTRVALSEVGLLLGYKADK